MRCTQLSGLTDKSSEGEFWLSRAQARTVLGREFPLATLSIVAGGPSSTIPYVSCAPAKIPDIEFSPVRLQAVASLDQPYPA